MIKKIADLRDGEWASIEGYIVGVSDGYSPIMSQYGIIADDTGAIKFVSWTKSQLPKIESSRWYQLLSGVPGVDNGVLNFTLNRKTSIISIADKTLSYPEIIPICDIQHGVVSFMGIVLSNDISHRGDVVEKGWIGDESGYRIPYTIKQRISHDNLEVGNVYRFLFGLVDLYQDRKDVTLDHCCIYDEENDLDLIPNIAEYEPLDAVPINPMSKSPCEQILSNLDTSFPSFGVTRAAKLSTIRASIERLRILYQIHDHLLIDYNDNTIQAAYMLRYFPYYIETSHHILNSICPEQISESFVNHMTISLYGCGAAPELLGILRFIQEHYPAINTANVNYFDQHDWNPWREFCARSLSEMYWEGNIANIHPSQWNFLSGEEPGNEGTLRMIQESKLHSIQNCFSDLHYSGVSNDTIIDRFIDLFQITSSGSLFILNDQHIAVIKTIFRQIADGIEERRLGCVIKKPTRYESHPLDCTIPTDLNDILSQRNLIKYYPLIIKRT
jgi:hypothetical protein